MSLFKIKNIKKCQKPSKLRKYHKTVDGLRRKTPVKRFKSTFAEVLQYDDTFRQFKFKNFEKSFPEFIKKVKQKAKNLLQTDWGTIFDLIIILENSEGEERVEIISTNYFQIMKRKDLIIHLDSLLGFFEEEFENFDSEWKLKPISHLSLKMIKSFYQRGGCDSCHLPDFLKNSKSILHLESKDNRCFYDSITYLEKKEEHEKLKNKKRVVGKESSLNGDGVCFPASKKDVAKLEKNNPGILVYIFEYDEEEEEDFFRWYCNKNFNSLRKESKIFNLLFFDGHFYPIVNPNGFNRMIAGEKKTHLCYFCHSGFRTEEKLEEHYEYCKEEYKVKTELPKPGSKVWFWKHSSTLLHPFVIYFDIECCLEPVKKRIGPKVVLVQNHKPVSFGMLFINHIEKNSFYKKFKTKEEFFEEINSILVYISSLQKEMEPEELEKANKEYENVLKNPDSVCSYCQKKFRKNDLPEYDKKGNLKIGKFEPVKDHCHFSGKFRGIVHKQCNTRRKDSYFLPIFAHNLMGYDEKLIIRMLKDMKVKIIAKNLENFISFEYAIQSNGKRVKARFLDSFKFLKMGLDKLAKFLKDEDFVYSKKFFKDYDEKIYKRKGVFCYDFVTSYRILTRTTISDKTLWTTYQNSVWVQYN